MIEQLIVIGGGEHARVVIDAARTRPDRYALVGFVDPAPCAETQALGVRWLGDDAAALREADGRRFIVAIGPYIGSDRRARVIERYAAAGVRFGSVIHQSAVVSAQARLGAGVTILAHATVNTGAQLGDHVTINSGAIVEHDVVVGAEAHVGPGAVVGGGARVGARVQLGLGCRVRDHVTLADDVMVGMGAVVVRSHGTRARLIGVPAREEGA